MLGLGAISQIVAHWMHVSPELAHSLSPALESLQKYQKGFLPFSVNTSILQLWLRKFKKSYLLKQTFFEPYPSDLMDIEAMTAYCNGKDYWQ